MDTDSRSNRLRFPFHVRVLASIALVFVIFAAAFTAYRYKIESLAAKNKIDALLQGINRGVYASVSAGGGVADFVGLYEGSDTDGLYVRVIADSVRTVYGRTGDGKRICATTDFGDAVVESSLPYGFGIGDMLLSDSGFLWFLLALAVAVGVVGYMLSMNLGHSIDSLRLFVDRVDKGLPTDGIMSFPDDELGDISGRLVRLYDQLRQAKEDLESEQNILLQQEQEQIRIKRQLTQNINHELKTPVSSIHGYLETILRTPNLSFERLMTFVENSYKQTVRLSQLLSDVSTLTRLDDGGQMIEKEPLDLVEVICEVINDTAVAASERGFKVRTSLPDKIMMQGSHSMLLSVFRNLMDNALAYSGGRNIEISLVRRDEASVTMSFADDGLGVAPEHLSRIFERFYRVDKGRSRKLGGTGLGLSIVKNAVLLHGGTISAYQRDMGGLEFIFTLRIM